MGWQLVPGMSYCLVDGDMVFLDLLRDRYFQLQGEDRAAFESLTGESCPDSVETARLQAAGVICWQASPRPIAPVHWEAPQYDLECLDEWPSTCPTIPMMLQAARNLAWARHRAKPGRIGPTLHELRRVRTGIVEPCDRRELIRLAAALRMCRMFLPGAPRCLIDSLALLNLAVKRHHAPRLVFGVRVRPFAAHCWIQSDDIALTGAADEARNFTPILVI